jgi:hypothetical protein
VRRLAVVFQEHLLVQKKSGDILLFRFCDILKILSMTLSIGAYV